MLNLFLSNKNNNNQHFIQSQLLADTDVGHMHELALVEHIKFKVEEHGIFDEHG